jgi:hypothetical protein
MCEHDDDDADDDNDDECAVTGEAIDVFKHHQVHSFLCH